MAEQPTQKRKCEEMMPVHVHAKRRKMQQPLKVAISGSSKATFAETEWKSIEGVQLEVR